MHRITALLSRSRRFEEEQQQADLSMYLRGVGALAVQTALITFAKKRACWLHSTVSIPSKAIECRPEC